MFIQVNKYSCKEYSLLSVTKFCSNGPCLEKMFWLRSNSNHAVQHKEDGLKFCIIDTILISWLVIVGDSRFSHVEVTPSCIMFGGIETKYTGNC